jgi:hypothetical protein
MSADFKNRMLQLNFPEFGYRLRQTRGLTEIFDIVRKKFVALTPEEWVRQHLLHYMVEQKNIPATLIGVEKMLVVNGLRKRYDLVVFSRSGMPALLAECKAPEVQITASVFDQAARYNLSLNATYFVITNGLQHFACQLDYQNKRYIFIEEIPGYSQIVNPFTK